MNDVTVAADTICTIFVKISMTVAFLCFAVAALRFSKQPKATYLMSFGAGQSTSNGTQTLVWTTPPTTPPVTATTPISVVQAPRVALLEPEQEEEEPVAVRAPLALIECGHCHNEIKSLPVRGIDGANKITDQYTCETCQSRVQVPITNP